MGVVGNAYASNFNNPGSDYMGHATPVRKNTIGEANTIIISACTLFLNQQPIAIPRKETVYRNGISKR